MAMISKSPILQVSSLKKESNHLKGIPLQPGVLLASSHLLLIPQHLSRTGRKRDNGFPVGFPKLQASGCVWGGRAPAGLHRLPGPTLARIPHHRRCLHCSTPAHEEILQPPTPPAVQHLHKHQTPTAHMACPVSAEWAASSVVQATSPAASSGSTGGFSSIQFLLRTAASSTPHLAASPSTSVLNSG
ncbi:uncharacterized protein LOC144316320 isoform X1 [Canis aureus]